MPRRRPRLDLVFGRRVAAELRPRVPDRMLGDQPVELRLGRLRQRVIGGAGVGELRVGAVRRDDAGVQHRPGRRLLPERAVGVPKLVALPIGAALVVERQDAALLVEVGDVEDVAVLDARRRQRPAVLAVRQRRHFERAVEARERDLLVVVEALVRQHADAILVHRVLDRIPRRAVDACGQISARQLRDEQRMQWLCRDGHAVLPSAMAPV